jgi:hypothetical protein
MKTPERNTTRSIPTRLSYWQAAREAVMILEKRLFPEDGPPLAIGFDAQGAVIASAETGPQPELVVLDGELLDTLVAMTLRSPCEIPGEGGAADIFLRNSPLLRDVAERFDRVAAVGSGLWGPALWDFEPDSRGEADPSRRCVDYVPLRVLDRIELHVSDPVAGRCCSRPSHGKPESPRGWDGVTMWRDRWEPLGLTAEESIAWTEVVGFRPEVAARLRSVGFVPRWFSQLYYDLSVEFDSERMAIVDSVLRWIDSGFTFREIDDRLRGGSPASEEELGAARVTRARAISPETEARERLIEGRSVMIAELLRGDSEIHVDGRRLSLEECVDRLEESGDVRGWMD